MSFGMDVIKSEAGTMREWLIQCKTLYPVVNLGPVRLLLLGSQKGADG